MIRAFTDEAWDQYQHWARTDRQIVKRINTLIEDTMRHPFVGIGKPEMLRANLSGHWSRRITDEHRLVYRVQDDTLVIIACRFHYE
ncbi:MAG: Txe/YoeB family addiction module toxin [Actinomycetota bacterium]|nr:Txe/YoeB family addiction module toxin [Actinomycetota bacterium]